MDPAQIAAVIDMLIKVVKAISGLIGKSESEVLDMAKSKVQSAMNNTDQDGDTSQEEDILNG